MSTAKAVASSEYHAPGSRGREAGAIGLGRYLLLAACYLLLVGCQPGSEKWTKWKMGRAQKFERAGSLVRAAEECADVVKFSKDPAIVASALFLEGDCLIRASRFEGAEAAFKDILERFKDGDPVYGQMARYRLVECYKAAGRPQDAATTLRTLLEKLDKKVERALALKDLGEILTQMADPAAGPALKEAAALFKDVAEDASMDPEFRSYARDLAAQTDSLAAKKSAKPGSSPASGTRAGVRGPEPTPRKLQ